VRLGDWILKSASFWLLTVLFAYVHFYITLNDNIHPLYSIILILLQGETWNVMKIGYQLKQVRERLAKGLVDKGILRTEKRNFLLFDMATHPVSDTSVKEEIMRRIITTLVTHSSVTTSSEPEIPYSHLRTVAMVCAAYAANVLENALMSLNHEMRERAYSKVDELLSDYSVWPFTARGVEIPEGKELQVEVAAAVLNVFTKMDSLL